MLVPNLGFGKGLVSIALDMNDAYFGRPGGRAGLLCDIAQVEPLRGPVPRTSRLSATKSKNNIGPQSRGSVTVVLL